MRLRSWTIDGVEHLDRVDSGELPNGLVVIYSSEETRKNAALSIIRRLLFASRTNGNGSSSGRGTAQVSGANGDFELSTNGAPGSEVFRRTDGEPVGDGDLGQLFGQIERQQLARFFDIRSDRLPRDLLDPAYVNASQSDTEPLSFEPRIQQLLSESDSAEIARLLTEIVTAEAALAEALEREAKFHTHQEDERRATDEVGRLCAELAELRRRRERLKAYATLWPNWIKRLRLERHLGELPPIEDFPESDISLVEAQEQAQDAALAAATCEKQLRQVKAELEALPEAGDRFEILESLTICDELPEYRRQMTAFARARARNSELETLLPMTEKRVIGEAHNPTFDPTTLDLAATREWLSRAESFNERETATRASLESTRAALKQLRSERQRAIRAAKTLDAELESADEQWRALWGLRDNLEELWEIQSQGEAAARKTEQRAEALEALDRGLSRVPNKVVRALLWVLVLGSFAAALWNVADSDSSKAITYSFVAMCGMIADFLLGWRSRWAELRNKEVRAGEDRLRFDLNRARQLRDSRWRSADQVSQRIEATARSLNLTSAPTLEEVEAVEERLFDACRKMTQRGPLAETALAIRDKRDEEEMLMAQLRDIRQTKEAAAVEWEDWKNSVGLPASIGQDGLTTYLCEHDRWAEMKREAVRVDEDLQSLAPQIEAWENRARSVLAAATDRVDDNLCGRDLEDALTGLRDSALRSSRLRQQASSLSEKVEDLTKQSAELSAKSREVGALYDNLRNQAGTSDEQEFERRRQIFLERRILITQIQEVEDVYLSQLADQRLADDPAIRADLTSGTADTWTEQAYDIETEIEQLESSMEEASHQRTVAAAACRDIETSNEVAVRQQELSALQAEMTDRADEWRTLAIARGLITEATKSMSGRGAVLGAASDSLRALTHGELVRITSANGNGDMVIVDRSGTQHHSEHGLPAQIARQVNLSLHFSIARDFARHRSPIPVVMDEVLADLEERQREATAREIHRLAAEQQVFYFTSDNAAVELLNKTGDVSRVLKV